MAGFSQAEELLYFLTFQPQTWTADVLTGYKNLCLTECRAT